MLLFWSVENQQTDFGHFIMILEKNERNRVPANETGPVPFIKERIFDAV
jgi:hypothetical protein